ncbi:MAG: alpha/beta hydrolase [Patescibacteria group bacterium]
MKLHHYQFTSKDDLPLPALLYESDEPSDTVAIFLHGNGSSSVFYSQEKMHLYAQSLNAHGISFFAFNNRGALALHSLKRRTSDGSTVRVPSGTAYEVIRDCIHDIDGAVTFLKQQGYTRFALIGESTGANKICVYHHYTTHSPFMSYVLLNGGDDSGIYYNILGDQEFFSLLFESKRMTEEGNGLTLHQHEAFPYPMSYQSIADMLDPDGDYNTFPFLDSLEELHLTKKERFHMFAAITKPTLVLYGEQDEYCYGKVPQIIELLRSKPKNPALFTIRTIPGGDHSFTGLMPSVTTQIAEWLAKQS